MGVPGFFLWLMKNYKKTNFVFSKDKLNNDKEQNNELIEEINNIDTLLIDANCLIHPSCFKVLAENPDWDDINRLENKMMNSTIQYIEKIIEHVKPTISVFIAIDGVAPLAKIKQQRTRRFKSVSDKNVWDNIKKKYNKPIHKNWSNSAITPGTEFMLCITYKISTMG
jgi:5'-3' exonuclease